VLERLDRAGLNPAALEACGFDSHPGHLGTPEAVRLRDGAEIFIRSVTPRDKGAIASGLERLSEESRYRRFFAPVHQLSKRDLVYLTEVDHHDHEALVAYDHGGEPLGVARFVRLHDEPTKAEVAVAVVDDWQGRGVATELLERLADRARDEGVETFTAAVLAENRNAIDLMRSLGPVKSVGLEPGLVKLEMEVPPRAGIGAFLKRALREAAAGALRGREPALRQPRARRRPDG
jgi:RimJ/RimL family protein N-acetyltransferase